MSPTSLGGGSGRGREERSGDLGGGRLGSLGGLFSTELMRSSPRMSVNCIEGGERERESDKNSFFWGRCQRCPHLGSLD